MPGSDVQLSPSALFAPRGECSCQSEWPVDFDSFGFECFAPGYVPEVPFGEGARLGSDHQVFVETWVGDANFGVLAVEDDPEVAALLG